MTRFTPSGDKPKVARSVKKLSGSLPPQYKLRVEVRRDGFSGSLYSQVRDIKAPDNRSLNDPPHCVVVDRQRGRHMDSETVKARAKSLSELLRLPYDEDLTWPCIAVQGHDGCRCSRCVAEDEK